MKESKPKCNHEWYDRSFLHPHRCGRLATRDGWCSQHHPDVTKARDELRRAKAAAVQALADARALRNARFDALALAIERGDFEQAQREVAQARALGWRPRETPSPSET